MDNNDSPSDGEGPASERDRRAAARAEQTVADAGDDHKGEGDDAPGAPETGLVGGDDAPGEPVTGLVDAESRHSTEIERLFGNPQIIGKLVMLLQTLESSPRSPRTQLGADPRPLTFDLSREAEAAANRPCPPPRT